MEVEEMLLGTKFVESYIKSNLYAATGSLRNVVPQNFSAESKK